MTIDVERLAREWYEAEFKKLLDVFLMTVIADEPVDIGLARLMRDLSCMDKVVESVTGASKNHG